MSRQVEVSCDINQAKSELVQQVYKKFGRTKELLRLVKLFIIAKLSFMSVYTISAVVFRVNC